MTDRYSSYEVVTPSDSTDVTFDALFVGGAGNVTVNPETGGQGGNITITGVTAGSILPIAGYRVRSTGTTATNIVALRI